jgi:hypothetical protein
MFGGRTDGDGASDAVTDFSHTSIRTAKLYDGLLGCQVITLPWNQVGGGITSPDTNFTQLVNSIKPIWALGTAHPQYKTFFPVVIMGVSYGGGAAVAATHALADNNITTALLDLFDPVASGAPSYLAYPNRGESLIAGASGTESQFSLDAGKHVLSTWDWWCPESIEHVGAYTGKFVPGERNALYSENDTQFALAASGDASTAKAIYGTTHTSQVVLKAITDGIAGQLTFVSSAWNY